MVDTLTVIAISLVLSFLLSELFYRFKYPRVMGQLLAGIILGLPLFRSLFSDRMADIKFLSDLGVIFLMLLTGLKLNLQKFHKAERDTLWIALTAALVPFFFGFVLMKAMAYSDIVALIVGACFSLTAEATSLKVFMDLKILNTRLGVIMLGAGILEDFFEVLFLSAVLLIAHKSAVVLSLVPVKLLIFVVLVFLTYRFFPSLLKIIQKERSRIASLSFIIIFAIIVSVVSKLCGVGHIIGAFVAGIIIHLSEHRKYEHKLNIKELEAITFAFVIPFFFINIGLHFDPMTFQSNLWLIIMVILMATLGKLIGVIASVPFTKITMRQAHIIGWGMNSRGMVELVIAGLAFQYKLIPVDVYSAIIVMAILTTLTFPVVLKALIKNDRSVLN